MNTNIKRFQECNKLEKLWRYRWYLAIPFIFLWRIRKPFPIQEMKEEDNELKPPEIWYASKYVIWRLVKGEMQMKMHWYYSTEEVFKNLK